MRTRTVVSGPAPQKPAAEAVDVEHENARRTRIHGRLRSEHLAEGNLGEEPEKTIKAALRGLAELYLASTGLHRVLAIEGLRVAKAEHVHAFDLRVIEVVRHFLASTEAPIQTENIRAAAFLVFQTVRAAMLSFLLERPPGLDIDRLIEELTRLLTGYLLAPNRTTRKKTAARRATKRRS